MATNDDWLALVREEPLEPLIYERGERGHLFAWGTYDDLARHDLNLDPPLSERALDAGCRGRGRLLR